MNPLLQQLQNDLALLSSARANKVMTAAAAQMAQGVYDMAMMAFQTAVNGGNQQQITQTANAFYSAASALSIAENNDIQATQAVQQVQAAVIVDVQAIVRSLGG